MRHAALRAGLLTLVLASPACRPSRVDLQRGYAAVLRPAALRAASSEPRPATRVLKLRAYADPDYEDHAPDWRERIAGQVERANALLAGEFGVRLEIEQIISSSREVPSPRPSSLAEALDDMLAALPPGVDFLVRFVGPVRYDADPSPDYEWIGLADLFRRRFVVRATQTSDDVARLDAVYDALPERERRALAFERRVHLEAATFLHEWGHSLGAVHECDDKWIMSPKYSVLHSMFSPESARLIQLGLQHLGPWTLDAAERWASDWRAEASRMQGAAWECEKLEEGLAHADALLTKWTRRLARARAQDPRAEASNVYVNDLWRAVRARWKVPEDAVPPGGGVIAVGIEVRIDATGALKAAQVYSSSGVLHVDEAALEAIRAAQPFARPPGEIIGVSGVAVFRIQMHYR